MQLLREPLVHFLTVTPYVCGGQVPHESFLRFRQISDV
jgi:hypothetical protein